VFDSIVLYAGGVITLAALLTRRWRLAAAGTAAMAMALAFPVWEKRIERRNSRLDDLMPIWQVNEVHAIDVAAPPAKTFDAIRKVTADEIAFFHTLTSIRRLGRSAPASIMNAPRNEPILDVALRTSFVLLADDAPREIVVGTRIAPGTLAAMNFLVAPDGRGGSRVTTETRVYSKTQLAAQQFAVYWRIIHPGSDIIRRMWLRAIRDRATRPS
jgi:hypothetical protein